MEEMSNIRPCPFCGHTPEMAAKDTYIFCNNKKCVLHSFLIPSEMWDTLPVTTHMTDEELAALGYAPLTDEAAGSLAPKRPYFEDEGDLDWKEHHHIWVKTMDLRWSKTKSDNGYWKVLQQRQSCKCGKNQWNDVN